MAYTTITFFPVGEKNGGMTLIKLNNLKRTTILIDSAIGDDLVNEYCDVNKELRNRLPKNSDNRPYVDAFILTHRHDDHLKGFKKNFHLGALSDYKDNDDELKIVINELWSSHNFWKPSSVNYSLCDDAKAFNKEMKRRVGLYEENNKIQKNGDRAIIIGTDPNGKTDKLTKINYVVGDKVDRINTEDVSSKLTGYILGPLEQQENEDDECFTNKNRQSIVIQFTIREGCYINQILMAADAECLVWETLWNKYKKTPSKLEYDILYAPHHCSWHSLSYDSQSSDVKPQVNTNAKNALSQCKAGAFIVSQSKIIKGADQDPPSKAAKDEYIKIIEPKQFICTNEYPDKNKPEPIEFNLTKNGPQLKAIREKSKLSIAALASTKEAYPHG